MTGQISDQFHYNGEAWNLAGVSGGSLPIPADFGMETRSSCTACWRGYVMRYMITDNKLIIDGMDLNAESPVQVNGTEPNSEKPPLFEYRYENIGLKADFTGRIMIAKDFIDDMYVHMGFQTAESYRTVIEFDIVNGDVTKMTDLSEEMKLRRQEARHKPEAPPSNPEGDLDKKALGDWIEDRFSQGYE